jgi:hypothetical protein
MMITPPRPPGEDYYLVVLGFRSGVDGFWTEYRAYHLPLAWHKTRYHSEGAHRLALMSFSMIFSYYCLAIANLLFLHRGRLPHLLAAQQQSENKLP